MMRPLIVLVAAASLVTVGAMAHAQSTSNPLILCSSISIQGNAFVCNQPSPLPTSSAVPTMTPQAPTPSPIPTAAPTAAATASPTAIPTATPSAGPIIFLPGNSLTFNSLKDAAQTVTFSQSNGGSFSAGQASTFNVVKYQHGALPSNSLAFSPKGYGTTTVPIVGAGGIVGFISITVNAPPTPQPTAAPTAAPTAPPTPAPTATPTLVPTATPTLTPTMTPTATPTIAPTEAPTPVPIALYPLAVTLTPGGKPHDFVITQNGFSTGFFAISNNPAVATASINGTTLTVTPHAVGAARIFVFGNGNLAPAVLDMKS